MKNLRLSDTKCKKSLQNSKTFSLLVGHFENFGHIGGHLDIKSIYKEVETNTQVKYKRILSKGAVLWLLKPENLFSGGHFENSGHVYEFFEKKIQK